MADAPFGVPGDDASRDSVGALSRGVVADRLRTLADWLDAHPSAVVSNITTYASQWTVSCFKAETVEQMYDLACEIDGGGEWKFEARDLAFYLGREIAPGVRFEFFLSRAKVDDVAAAA